MAGEVLCGKVNWKRCEEHEMKEDEEMKESLPPLTVTLLATRSPLAPAWSPSSSLPGSGSCQTSAPTGSTHWVCRGGGKKVFSSISFFKGSSKCRCQHRGGVSAVGLEGRAKAVQGRRKRRSKPPTCQQHPSLLHAPGTTHLERWARQEPRPHTEGKCHTPKLRTTTGSKGTVCSSFFPV